MRAKPLPDTKGVLFDLGNTLYDKMQYLDASFRNVADYLHKNKYLDKKLTLELLYRIWKIKTSHYEFLFKDFLEIIGLYSPPRHNVGTSLAFGGAKLLDDILRIYHSTKAPLKPYKNVPLLLAYLKKYYKIGLLTDGHPQMQRLKLKTLGWDKAGKPFDVIVYTADYEKPYLKPNPFVYQLAVEKLGLTPGETVYVGDNPSDDFIGAKETGIFTIRVLQGEFKSVRLDKNYEADMTIGNIYNLKNIL